MNLKFYPKNTLQTFFTIIGAKVLEKVVKKKNNQHTTVKCKT